MIVIGIDPHVTKDYAVCTIQDGIIIGIDKYDSVTGIYDSLIGWVENGEKIAMYIEDQYFGRNVSTLTQLAHSAGKIAGACELLDIPYEFVSPTLWQKGLDIPRKTKEYSAYEWKKLHVKHLIDKAQEFTDIPIKDDDMASSVLISIYGFGQVSDFDFKPVIQ